MRSADAVSDDVQTPIAIDITDAEPMDAVEFPVNNVQRPGRIDAAGVFNPGNTEVGTLGLRRVLTGCTRLAKIDPRDLIAPDDQIEIAVQVSIERHAIKHLSFQSIEDDVRRPIWADQREDL